MVLVLGTRVPHPLTTTHIWSAAPVENLRLVKTVRTRLLLVTMCADTAYFWSNCANTAYFWSHRVRTHLHSVTMCANAAYFWSTEGVPGTDLVIVRAGRYTLCHLAHLLDTIGFCICR